MPSVSQIKIAFEKFDTNSKYPSSFKSQHLSIKDDCVSFKEMVLLNLTNFLKYYVVPVPRTHLKHLKQTSNWRFLRVANKYRNEKRRKPKRRLLRQIWDCYLSSSTRTMTARSTSQSWILSCKTCFQRRSSLRRILTICFERLIWIRTDSLILTVRVTVWWKSLNF